MTTVLPTRNTPDRMDMPFVGHVTFARQPACADWDKLDGADVAVLGIPIDTASSFRSGSRFGPRAIRDASMFHAFGPEGVFDFEDEVTYLSAEDVRIVDAGDADVIYADARLSLANAEQAVRALLDAKTMPFILGGDHAISAATIAAYADQKPIHIVHIDAHVDFIDGRNGISWGHGSPMRRASEMPHVKGITTLGPRNMGAVGRKDWEAARAYGTHLASLRQVRASRRRRLAAPHPGRRARLCLARHRRLRSLDRAGHRHDQPWRLHLLRSPRPPEGTRPAHRDRRRRSGGSLAALRSLRHHGTSRRPHRP